MLRSGEHELERYLTFAEASGMMGEGIVCKCDAIYTKKMPPPGESTEPFGGFRFGFGFGIGWYYNQSTPTTTLVTTPIPTAITPQGWFCNMSIVRLPGPEGGCLIYSPVLGQDNTMAPVVAALEEHALLPVRFVVAPTPQHHLALHHYQRQVAKGPPSLYHSLTAPLHHSSTLPLHHSTSSPLHHSTTSPLHHFTPSPLHHFTTSPLHHFTIAT